MISGRQAVAEVSQAARGQQQALDELDARLVELRGQQQALLHERAEQLKALARMHVERLDVGCQPSAGCRGDRGGAVTRGARRCGGGLGGRGCRCAGRA
jgi:hypothetical protein